MAANIVGDAYVVVRAITSSVESDIRKAFDGVDREGERAGDRVSQGFKKGFNRGNQRGFQLFSPNFLAQANAARSQFQSLTRLGYFLAPAITAVSGAIGVVITGLTSLVSVIGAAAGPALVTLAGAFTALGQAAITAKLAFSGVAKAIQAGNKAAKPSIADKKAEERLTKALNKAQKELLKTYEDAAESEALARRNAADATDAYTESLAKAREELQQLAFDSEDAAINEQKAALDLEKARETLARVSDLPPNSRARKEAELAFAEADLNYRRAIDANNDLKKQEAENAALGPDLETQAKNQKEVLRAKRDEQDALDQVNKTILDNVRAIEDATEARDEAQKAKDNYDEERASASAYADALSDLSKEAQDFVKYIVSLKDEFKELKAAAGEKLFPQLETAIQNLVTNLFPKLKPLLTETGDVLGKIAIKISETITSAENLKRLENIWKTNNDFLLNLGDATANLYEVFLILLDAAKPLIDEFGKWLVTITNTWKETLKAEEASGKLAKKFDTARLILKDLGTIFGNTFRGIGNIISANVGPGSGGQIFLNYLKDVTKSFENLKTIDGKPIRDFFADAAENGTLFLDLLGNIVGGFITLADNPELGVFFKQLNTVTDVFQRIGENLTGSLPAFGNFLIQFSLFFEKITEAGSVTIFFNVLSSALERLNSFLDTEIGQKLLQISAAVLPVLAAFGLLAKTVGFFGKVVIGSFVAIFGPIVKLGSVLVQLGVPLSTVVTTFLRFAGIAGLVITAFTLMWQNSEIFREAIMLMVQAIGGALKGAFDDIMGAIKSVFPTFEGLGTVFETIGNIVGTVLVPILTFSLTKSIGVVSGAIQKFIYIIGSIKETFMAVWNVVKGIFYLFTGQTDKAANSFKSAWGNAVNAVKNAIKSLAAPFVGVLNAISDAWNNSVGKFSFTVPDWVPKIGGQKFNVPNLPRINLANLAEGGVVLPTPGGTIARIAEAGRPERIEPLDPQGLSVRDRAIITELAKEAGIGNQVNITVNPSPGMDERELASIVARQISYSLRMGAA